MGLEGRVAMVTGAGRGIGEAIARALAADGAAVAVCDVDGTTAAASAQRLSEGGARALAVQMDVTDSAAVRQAAERITRELGPIDILVNNAGWDKVEPFVQSTEETWDKVIAINLKGPIRCARAVLDGMIERRRGKIISIGSDAGRVGSSGEAVYSAAKGGVIAFTKTLARELARYNVNVNCVCPGPTDTQLLADVAAGNPRLADALKRAIPLGRLGQPKDIAAAVAFLASEGADFITGQTLSVSGGLTMS
jgi:2-hydroxycyclohexanecarboxyl-CoA dehydrogenase